MKRKDLIGQKFGRLTVIKLSHRTKKHAFWECLCECGNTKIISLDSLRTGNSNSCGCIKIQSIRQIGHANAGKPAFSRIDLTGQKFGRLVVIKYAYTKKRQAYWECLCECGQKTITSSYLLTSNKTKSCKCLNKEMVSQLGSVIGFKNSKNSHGQWKHHTNGKIITMRSSFELMVAQIFDRYNLKFHYESQVFKLENGLRYKPDFYLPEYNRYIEVKGYFTDKAKEKLQKFKNLGYDIQVWQQRKIEYEYGSKNSIFIKEYRLGKIL